MVSTVKVAGISMETTRGLRSPITCYVVYVIQTIITAIKIRDETGGSCQQKVKQRHQSVPASLSGGQSTGGLVGEQLCVLIQRHRLLRTSACGEIAPCSPRRYGCPLSYNCAPFTVCKALQIANEASGSLCPVSNSVCHSTPST